MLENIPTVTKEDIESLVEQEIKKTENQTIDLMDELDKTNPNLARAIKAIAQTTAQKTFVDNYWRQKVEAKFVEAMLVVAGVINQAFETKGAEEHSMES